MRLRQLVFAAEHLESAVDAGRSLFGLEVAYRDPSVAVFGLENVLLPIGEQDFLEIVSPVKEDTAAGRYMARRGGDTGYMVILQCPDARAVLPRIEELGVRVAWQFESERYSSYHLHPRDCGGVILSIDSTSGTPLADDWMPAGPSWRDSVRTDVVRSLAGVTLGCGEPDRIAELWSRISGCALREPRVLPLENATVRFTASAPRGPGLEAFAVELANESRAQNAHFCGTRVEPA